MAGRRTGAREETPLLANAVSDSLARAVSVQASLEAHLMLMPELPSAPAAAAAVDAMTLPTTAADACLGRLAPCGSL
jgi:hypothetical protein